MSRFHVVNQINTFSILNLKICASVSRDRSDLLILLWLLHRFRKVVFSSCLHGYGMVAFSNRSTLNCVFKSLRFRGPFPSFPCKQVHLIIETTLEWCFMVSIDVCWDYF